METAATVAKRIGIGFNVCRQCGKLAQRQTPAGATAIESMRRTYPQVADLLCACPPSSRLAQEIPA